MVKLLIKPAKVTPYRTPFAEESTSKEVNAEPNIEVDTTRNDTVFTPTKVSTLLADKTL